MRLYSFLVSSPLGLAARVGAEVGGHLVDLNAACAAWFDKGRQPDPVEYAGFLVPPDMVGLMKRGEKAWEAVRGCLDFVGDGDVAGVDGARVVYEFGEVRLLAPVPRPNIVWDSMVFLKHFEPFYRARGGEVPEVFFRYPPYFTQSAAIVVGPHDPILKPRFTEQLDFEFEFGIYIGKKGINIREGEAGPYIAGFTVYNDVSARDMQFDEMEMRLGPAKGKAFEHANIMGPCLVTPDEIDYRNLRMVARVNGEVVVEDNSADMHYGFERIIERISEEQYLYPGDFIGSGTTNCGTCQASTLKRWLQVGDVVELEVEGIGVLRNEVLAAPGDEGR